MEFEGTRPAIPAAIAATGVVAIGRRLEAARVAAIAEALLAGGVRAFELTLNEPESLALASIEELARRFEDSDLLIGAGTVLSIAAAGRAIDAGARFLVSPHLDAELVSWAAGRGVPFLPGAFTPTEVLAAWRAGAAAVKLFPASVAGPALVRELRGPLPIIALLPTGGVTLESAPAFISAGAVGVGMGSWLTGDGAPPASSNVPRASWRPSPPPARPRRPGLARSPRKHSEPAVKITDVSTYLVGNAWKNWLFVRVDTDEGIHGVGEGTLNAFSATVQAAIHELRDTYIGLDPSQVELLLQRMVRDVYSDGGQIHMAAVSAIEVACWDIRGKAVGKPVHELLGGRIRERIRVYANGWYRTERTPEAFAERARQVVASGYTALKFDPFGAGWRVQDRREEDLSIDIVAAVREAVGADVDLMIEAHCRFSAATALRIADRLAEHRPAWLEEPVAHHHLGSMVEVARRSPVPGRDRREPDLAEPVRRPAVPRRGAHPAARAALPGWAVADPAAGRHGRRPLRGHRAAQRTGAHLQRHLDAAGSQRPQLLHPGVVRRVQRAVVAARSSDHPVLPVGGYVEVSTRPGLGIDLDWDRLAEHPYERQHQIRLFKSGWERRDDAPSRPRSTAWPGGCRHAGPSA